MLRKPKRYILNAEEVSNVENIRTICLILINEADGVSLEENPNGALIALVCTASGSPIARR